VQPYGLDAGRHERRREREAELARLEAQTRPPWTSEADAIADADAHPEAWEIARRRMYANFSYAALDRALEQLAQTHPGISAQTPLAMMFIDARMPTPIRAPRIPELGLTPGRSMNGHMLKKRDQLIRRQVLAEGQPVQLVARQHGLTPARVNQVCKPGLPTSDRPARMRSGASPETG